MVERSVEQEFENLVGDIFERHKIQVNREVKIKGSFADLTIESTNGRKGIVEVKLYRTKEAPAGGVLRAAEVLYSEISKTGLEAGILVIGNTVSEQIGFRLKDKYPSIITYDIRVLYFLANQHSDLLDRLDNVLRRGFTFSDIPSAEIKSAEIEKDISKRGLAGILLSATEISRPGAELAGRLDALHSGQGHAREFETLCLEALRYIFDKDLTSWSSQFGTEERTSIFDVIARVNSQHDFWRLITSKFNSRYIVFEFKNYSDKIKQGQIYTTEKYLFRAALRSTAIIISREGADKNALKACRGALREHGKLILNLSLTDVRAMLDAKDLGEDHNEPLVELLDGFLMKLEA